VAAALLAATLVVLCTAWWRSALVAPDPTLLLQDRHGEFLGEAGDPEGEFGYWRIEPLPERVVAATLALEDRRFWSHPGVDAVALARAGLQNLRARRRVSGASTLAMQVARLQQPGARSYPRKALEALTALLMTARHGRGAVLAHYLRVVPYGNRIRGIGYAARRYLDKPVDDLSWAETAFLSAIPQAPARMNPFVPSGRERAVRRGQRILDELRRQGVLGLEEHDLARRQIVALAVPPAGERPREAMHAVLRLSEELRTADARRAFARRPVLRTHLDLALQREVAGLALQCVDAWEPQGARNAAVVVLDRRSAEVLAWVGSADYFDARRAGAIDYARVPRSPGSALKPFVYALALERGTITPATVLDDIERGPGGIGNADEAFLGPLLPRLALANSRNVPAAELLARVGVHEAYAFLRELGLHAGSEPARRYGLGLAIGGLPVTLEALVRAYTTLAADGRLLAPSFYEGQPRPEPRRVLSEDTARSLAMFLSDPLARLPSFARMGSLEYPFPVAVKTGTSSRFRDAWTVAFSTRVLVGVWVGDPDVRPMNRLSGQRSAAELARRVLLRLHRDQADGLEDFPFPPPRGSAPVKLCALSGQRATAACDRVLLEYLVPGAAPPDDCAAHVRLLVDARTGRPATAATPAADREARSVVDLPPRYAAWLAASGLPRLASPEAALALGGQTQRLLITSPHDGLRVLRDPETPADRATLALRAVVDPPSPQLVWFVDGEPFEVVPEPYATRWGLRPGVHVIEARLPSGAATARVRVEVE
jgi:penicillin-binding protein 1C